MWIERVTTSNDVCVGDITPFRTVEWWENKSKACRCVEADVLTIPHEPEPINSVCTDNKIDVKKYFEEKPFGNERLSKLRETFGDAMAEKKTPEQRVRAKQIRKKQK